MEVDYRQVTEPVGLAGSILVPDEREDEVPVVPRGDVWNAIPKGLIIIDSGAGNCVLNESGQSHLAHLVRDARGDLEFDTAGGKVKAAGGCG